MSGGGTRVGARKVRACMHAQTNFQIFLLSLLTVTEENLHFLPFSVIVFLATLVALHFTPVSESVSESQFRIATFQRSLELASLFTSETIAIYYITLCALHLKVLAHIHYIRKLLQYITLHCIASESSCSNLLHQKLLQYITLHCIASESSCANLLHQKLLQYITIQCIALESSCANLLHQKLLQYITLHCIASESSCANYLHQKLLQYITLHCIASKSSCANL